MAEERVQRRLAAILVADVVGYSRLMGADEEGTLAALTAHRTELIQPCVAEHRGRVVKTMGDGLLVEFASVVDAVRCAVAFQEGMRERNADTPEDRRIDFRIGVNLGDVIIQDDDVYGDGVNVAARLEGLAEPGSVVVSGIVHEAVRSKIDHGFEDLGTQAVRNIAEPVRVYRVTSATAKPVVDVFAPKRLSIVVLPFTNLSGDEDQEYFADCLTEDLITDLSRIRGAFVIARSTSFTYKNVAVDVKKVAADLGVRYVLEGSARRVGDRVRFNVQLIDGTTGSHIWSDRFDREFSDVFALQNEVTGQIARTLDMELVEAESRRIEQGTPESLEAQDYVLRGWASIFTKAVTEQNIREAKDLFERALELDPNLASAWTGLARVHYAYASHGWGQASLVESRKLQFEAAQRAVALDPKNSDAHSQLGFAYRLGGMPEMGMASYQTALELNPNNDDACQGVAMALIGLGRPDEAFPLLDRSFRLNPRIGAPGRRYYFLGMAHLFAGNDGEAVSAVDKGIAANPEFASLYWVKASALGWLGRTEEARAALAELSQRDEAGRNTIEGLRIRVSHVSPDLDRALEGLRRAGMPEK